MSSDPIRVVVVCTGNICRSPMAEGILRDRWLKEGRNDLIVTSMGIRGLDSNPATETAKSVCQEHGIDISSHRSRPIVPEELAQANLILTMDNVQKEYVQLFFPNARGNVFLLGAWPGDETRKSPVNDPIGGSLKTYRRTFEKIARHVDRVVPSLQEMYG